MSEAELSEPTAAEPVIPPAPRERREPAAPPALAIDEEALQREYAAVQNEAAAAGATDYFLRFARMFAEGHARRYLRAVRTFKGSLKGSTFVDYGSKYGFVTPFLIHLGVEKVICVDVKDQYLEEGRRFFSGRYNVEYLKSENCIIDVKPGTVGFVLVNEVISHINVNILPSFYGEMARVLGDGGEMLISDGNNLANLETRVSLYKSYEQWENGGSREWGEISYRGRRADLIARRFPKLTPEEVSYLAANTSGLWGDQIYRVAEDYARDGVILERPYRLGTSPTNPTGGVMMERGFFPDEVERSLQGFGFETAQLVKDKPVTDPAQRGTTKNFTIWARKVPSTLEALLENAKADHLKTYGVDPDEALREGEAAAAKREANRPWWRK